MTAAASTLITVSGTVVDASGAPVADMQVWWQQGAGSSSMTTGNDGTFTLPDITSGPATLHVDHPASLGTTQIPDGYQSSASVNFAADTNALTVALPKFDTVAVTVQGADGTPVDNANVWLQSPSSQLRTCPSDYTMIDGATSQVCSEFTGPSYGNYVRTDADGHAETLWLPAPTTQVTISATDPNNGARTVASTPFLTATTPTVTLTLPSTITVSGTVVDASGAPVADMQVWWQQGAGSSSMTTGNDGTFTLPDITSGPATLHVDHPASLGTTQIPDGYQSSASVNFAADTNALTVALPKFDTVAVTVQGADGTPVDNANVWLQSPSSQLRTCPSDYTMIDGATSQVCSEFTGPSYGNYVRTDADGHAETLWLPAPTTQVTISATDPNNGARTVASTPFLTATTPTVTLVVPDRPSAPQTPATAAASTSLTTTWQAPASDGGSAITAYTVTVTPVSSPTSGARAMPAAAASGAKAKSVNVAGTARSAKITGLTTGATYSVAVRALNAVGKGPAATTVATTSHAVAPTVATLSVTSGPTKGGTDIVITGTGFTAGASVQLGRDASGNPVMAQGVQVVSSTKLRATTSASAAGTYPIVVTTSSGTSTGSTSIRFTFLERPTIGTLSPARGPVAGGTTVTLTGSGFAQGATVWVAQGTGVAPVAAQNVVVVSSTRITATMPPSFAAGKFLVTVSTPGGSSARTRAAIFAYQ